MGIDCSIAEMWAGNDKRTTRNPGRLSSFAGINWQPPGPGGNNNVIVRWAHSSSCGGVNRDAPTPGLFTSACAWMMAFDDNGKQGQSVVIDLEGEVKPSVFLAYVAPANPYNNVMYILCLELNIDN